MPAPVPSLTPRRPELDGSTLARAQAGDPAACTALVERYERPVFALLHRMGAGKMPAAAVEDLAQETFLRVFRALGRFDPSGPARLSTWSLSIATRLSLDAARRGPPAADPIEAHVDTLVTPPDAEETLERRRLGEALREAAALSPQQRATFLLSCAHGLDQTEIASALGLPLGTVKSRLSRARAAMVRALSEVHDG